MAIFTSLHIEFQIVFGRNSETKRKEKTKKTTKKKKGKTKRKQNEYINVVFIFKRNVL